MFRTEGSELVKGSMLAMTIESILDLAGERSGKFRMIECEVSSHDAYGTPRDLFLVFRRRELGLGFHGVPRFRPIVVMQSASVVVLVS